MTTKLPPQSLFLVSVFASLLAILCVLHQMQLESLREAGRVWIDRVVQDVGRELKETCTYVDDLKGCEGKPTS